MVFLRFKSISSISQVYYLYSVWDTQAPSMFQSLLKIPAIRILLEYFVSIAFSKELLTQDKIVYVSKFYHLERRQTGHKE